jgi:hypothetical protein
MFGPYGSSEQAHDYDISYRRSFDLFFYLCCVCYCGLKFENFKPVFMSKQIFILNV